MSDRVLTEVAQELLNRHPAACECFRCRSLRDLLDARRERDEALDDKWKLLKIVTDKNVELLTLQRELIAWRAAIQRITPGGSEFMDPESVERWAQKQNRELGQTKMDVVKLRRGLDEARPVLEAARELLAAQRKCYEYPKDGAAWNRYADAVVAVVVSARAAGGGEDE
jgi:hypothetical protein